MRTFYGNVTANESEIHRMHKQRDAVQSERDGLEQSSFIAELKGESDYRALFVSRLQEGITTENNKKTGASGDDADVTIAEAEAAIAWYTERLTEQQELAEYALEEYKENKLVFDTEVERYNERIAI